FPTLLAVGLPPVAANVTNSIAVSPGYLGSVIGSRYDLAGQGARARGVLATAAGGSATGGAVLLVAPPRSFEAVVPFLGLAAAAAGGPPGDDATPPRHPGPARVGRAGLDLRRLLRRGARRHAGGPHRPGRRRVAGPGHRAEEPHLAGGRPGYRPRLRPVRAGRLARGRGGRPRHHRRGVRRREGGPVTAEPDLEGDDRGPRDGRRPDPAGGRLLLTPRAPSRPVGVATRHRHPRCRPGPPILDLRWRTRRTCPRNSPPQVQDRRGGRDRRAGRGSVGLAVPAGVLLVPPLVALAHRLQRAF